MPTVAITRVVTFDVEQAVTISRQATFDVISPVAISRQVLFDLSPVWLDDPSTCPVRPSYSQIFTQVNVDEIYVGGSRISWTLSPHFVDPLPWSFQLQGSHHGLPSSDDWFNIGSPQQNVTFLADPTQQLPAGKTSAFAYRVSLTSTLGTYYSPPATILGKLDVRGALLVNEWRRKETLIMRLNGAVRGYLLRPRRYGTVCTLCIEPITGECTNTDCPECLGVGFLDPYEQPLSCMFAESTPEKSRESINLQVGTDKPVVIQGRFVAPATGLWSRDIFANQENGRRYMIHTVSTDYHWRGVPVTQTCELRLLPYSDIVYTVELP